MCLISNLTSGHIYAKCQFKTHYEFNNNDDLQLTQFLFKVYFFVFNLFLKQGYLRQTILLLNYLKLAISYCMH